MKMLSADGEVDVPLRTYGEVVLLVEQRTIGWERLDEAPAKFLRTLRKERLLSNE